MTDCLDPIAPTDEELICYALDGEPMSDEVKNHLDTCSTCKQRIALYAGANAFLVSNLYRSQCPSSTQLTDYCALVSLHLSSDEERTYITEHVRICPLCSAEIVRMQHNLAFDIFPEQDFSISPPFLEKVKPLRLVAEAAIEDSSNKNGYE